MGLTPLIQILILASDFDGTWVMKSDGQPVLKLTLATSRGRIAGSLTKPTELSIEQDGEVTAIGVEQQTFPIRNASLKSGQLTMKIDGDRFVMTTQGNGRATLGLPGMRPWTLERVPDSGTVVLATSLPQPAYPDEIRVLREQLESMVKEDQDARLKFDQARMEAADTRNRTEVLRIFERYGWVTRSLAGNKASHNYWLLVQHQTPDIQQRLLPALQKAAEANEASMTDYAYLYDRVQIGLGKPQRWGTQTTCENGKVVLSPVEEAANLHARRSELYMMPVADYLKADYLVKFCALAKHEKLLYNTK